MSLCMCECVKQVRCSFFRDQLVNHIWKNNVPSLSLSLSLSVYNSLPLLKEKRKKSRQLFHLNLQFLFSCPQASFTLPLESWRGMSSFYIERANEREREGGEKERKKWCVCVCEMLFTQCKMQMSVYGMPAQLSACSCTSLKL